MLRTSQRIHVNSWDVCKISLFTNLSLLLSVACHTYIYKRPSGNYIPVIQYFMCNVRNRLSYWSGIFTLAKC